LLVVLTKLLTNEGAGRAEIYGGRCRLVLAPPRSIPVRALPAMSLRAG
jgi:hypothetical protein